MLNILVYKQSLQFYTGKKYIHNSWNIFKRPEQRIIWKTKERANYLNENLDT